MKRFALVLSMCTFVILAAGFAMYFQASGQHHRSATVSQDPGDASPRSSATVSFGGWITNVPMDRFPNDANTQFPRLQNHHQLTPEIATIKAGGTVNFIIGGFHVVTVYDDGTRPEDINKSLLTTPANQPAPPIINDPNRRIYRGLDPSLLPRPVSEDRVEVVQFDEPGVYLVICAVLPHFNDGMYGYVRVVGNSNDD